MERSTRISIEVFGPAFVGTVMLFIWKWEEFINQDGMLPLVFLWYLGFAYVFAIIPSLAYAFLMETWLKRCGRVRFRALWLVLLSSLLGTTAGFVIKLASEAPVEWIGALVGLTLGLVLSCGVSSKKAF